MERPNYVRDWKAAQIANEMKRYGIQVLGICESRWNGSGLTKLSTGESVIYSGHPEDNHTHTEGVAIMMSPTATKALIQWEAISSRIMTARFNSKGRKVSIIQCYAPTNNADLEKKEEFYRQLQATMDNTPAGDMKILMGDMNAKLGPDNTGRELIMGREALGEMNENGELFADFCAFNELVIGGSVYKHKDIHKATWVSPDGQTKNQIDFISISRKWRRSLLDTKARRGADVGSDHYLVQGTIQIKLKAFRESGAADRPQAKFNTQKLKDQATKDIFIASIKDKAETQINTSEEVGVEKHWNNLKTVWSQTCIEILGRKKRQDKQWLTTDTWKLIEERRTVKQKIIQCTDEQQKQELNASYNTLNKRVKKSAREDKRKYYETMANEAEQAAGKGDLATLYQTTRNLSGKRSTQIKPIKDDNGKSITKEVEQRKHWVEHFKRLLNRPPPTTRPAIPTTEAELPVNTDPPTKSEVLNAIKMLKTGKTPGPDGIPAEALKIDPETTADLMTPLLEKVWKEGKVPEDWKNSYLFKLPKKGDLSQCKNWRGIMLLSIPSKILSRIILERIKQALDEKLRPEQAGFRRNKSCIDQIATLRIIIEQSLEWQSPLYLNFIDFEKAFDSVDREVIWKLLRYYGVPSTIIHLIQQLYDNAACQVIHNGKLTEAFEVRTGVRQGCLLSPMIFLIAIDWIMRQTTATNEGTGIKWTDTKDLEDLDFADDICLISHKLEDMQVKSNKLAEEASKIGLHVNIDKTEMMKIPSQHQQQQQQQTTISINGKNLKETTSFTYLGSIVSTTGGTDEDIKARIGKARQAFITLKSVWRSTAISIKNKIRIFNSNVKSVLLYGSETWRVIKSISNKLQTFINNCLRSILKIRWPEKISNRDLWERTNQEPIVKQIGRKKWRWIGHTLRKPSSDITRQALEWNPKGRRRVGRPRVTWRRSCEEEMKACGQTWSRVKKLSENRSQWRCAAEALCSSRN
uniref:Reverse transcriptase domain-containing protein n=1 Tax=Trichobilharzia regenti TaxID=157069 RepID=A0AA85K4Z6_TRIRE|nr:unnamed protein product [Trichobilharzia regenti]